MSLKPSKGKWITKWFPRTASVTFTNGDLVMFTSGLVATATAQSKKHLGILLTAVTSGDSNFATAAVKVPVAIPTEPSCEFISDVTGTLLTTDLGLQFDMSTAGLVNQDGTTYKVVTCKQFISTSQGAFSLNSSLEYADTTWD